MLRKLGKYELLDELGHGGMATVYRAKDTLLRRDVALKVMHPHLRGAEQARARFGREAQSVARVKHPHILEIYDFSGDDSTEAYIVTELLTGPTLRKFIDDHPQISSEIVACFGLEIASALHAAHAVGIIHRDVKPENVLIHDARVIKLTDFGIAQMVDSHTMTATGQMIGSPGHMAPEQIDGRDCDARTDLFSLGTVLYALATAKPTFSGKNAHQILRRVMESDYVDPLRLAPSLAPPLRHIITRLLEHDPDKRFASAKELEGALLAFLADMRIDDPFALLARYLGAPDAIESELRPKVLERTIALGEAALARKERLVALDWLNRALALDDGNPRVLALVSKARRRSKSSRWISIVGISLAVIGCFAGALAWALRPGPAIAPHVDSSVREPTPPEKSAPPVEPVEPVETVVPDAEVPLDASSRDGAVVVPVLNRPIPMLVRSIRPVNTSSSAPRNVEFTPTPQSVLISVDGAEPREFGPSFRGLPLPAGSHRIVYSGPGIFETSRVIDVPEGDGVFRVRHRVPFRAGIKIDCRSGDSLVSGTVRIGDAVTIRCNVIEAVPLDERTQVFPLAVEADGFRTYNGEIRLDASRSVTLVTARLVPTAIASPPP
jgi:hypothetical protein